MPKWLQPNPAVSQWNVRYEAIIKLVITFGHEQYFSLAKRMDLHFAKCLAQHSHNRCCKMVLWAEVVTMW